MAKSKIFSSWISSYNKKVKTKGGGTKTVSVRGHNTNKNRKPKKK